MLQHRWHQPLARPRSASQPGHHDMSPDHSQRLRHPDALPTPRQNPPFAPRQAQQDSFRVQIEAARQLNVPIIIHSRDADEDMAHIIEEEYQKAPFKGVLHCFSSGEALAMRALDIGFFISFSGILTFPKSTQLREIASKIPLDRVLVETDAPFLAPAPFRGKTNEPAYTVYTLKILSEALSKPVGEMGELRKISH